MNLKIHLQFNDGAAVEIVVLSSNFHFGKVVQVGDLTFLLSTIKEIIIKPMP